MRVWELCGAEARSLSEVVLEAKTCHEGAPEATDVLSLAFAPEGARLCALMTDGSLCLLERTEDTWNTIKRLDAWHIAGLRHWAG